METSIDRRYFTDFLAGFIVNKWMVKAFHLLFVSKREQMSRELWLAKRWPEEKVLRPSIASSRRKFSTSLD